MIPPRIDQIFERMRDISQRFDQVSKGPDVKVTPDNPSQADLKSHPTDPISGTKNLSFESQLDSLIREKASRYGVNEKLIRAVLETESGAKPDAVSPKGAIGLMQLMPDTARYLQVDPTDPAENLDGGVRYLKELAGKFGSLDEVLAAYNAGPGKVSRYGGVPPYRETKDYIEKIRGKLADFRQ